VCDGFPVPGDLAALAAAAITGFAFLTARFCPVELRDREPYRPVPSHDFSVCV
jgi:hypothetical protein